MFWPFKMAHRGTPVLLQPFLCIGVAGIDSAEVLSHRVVTFKLFQKCELQAHTADEAVVAILS